MRMPSAKKPDGAARAPRVIKRYANRKLYDTEESTYVTLEEIAEAIREGEEVRIIDNKTQEDLTSVTLTQIIFEQEKKRSLMPLGLLLDLIRSGGAQLSGYLQSGVGQVVTGGLRGKLAPKGRAEAAPASGARQGEPVSQAEGRDAAADANSMDNLKKSASPQLQGKVDQTKELLSQIQKSLDDWHQQLDSRVHQTVEQLAALPTLANEMNSLEKRIRELEARLEDLDFE